MVDSPDPLQLPLIKGKSQTPLLTKEGPGVVDSMRTFIAVHLTEDLRTRVKEVQEVMMRSGGRLRYVQPGLLHFTLVFLGEIDEDAAAILGERLQDLASNLRGFDITIEGCGAFPNEKSPRVYWLGVKEGAEQLTQLQKQVSAATRDLGLQHDDKFKPHLTLARTPDNAREGFRIPERVRNAVIGRMTVDRICLVKSDLTPKGPIYTDLVVAQLARS